MDNIENVNCQYQSPDYELEINGLRTEQRLRTVKSTGHFHVRSQVVELRYKFDNLMVTIASVQIHILQQKVIESGTHACRTGTDILHDHAFISHHCIGFDHTSAASQMKAGCVKATGFSTQSGFSVSEKAVQ